MWLLSFIGNKGLMQRGSEEKAARVFLWSPTPDDVSQGSVFLFSSDRGKVKVTGGKRFSLTSLLQ